MANLEFRASLLVGPCLALAVLSLTPADGLGAECKRKTAGFYLQDTNAEEPRRLSLSLKSTPASLTGTPGDPQRGHEVLVSREKGDCLSCHKLSMQSNIAEQGGIGPALDGIGSRFSEGQLRQAVADPKAYFPETIMPSYHKAGEGGAAPILTASEVEDLVAYLQTLK